MRTRGFPAGAPLALVALSAPLALGAQAPTRPPSLRGAFTAQAEPRRLYESPYDIPRDQRSVRLDYVSAERVREVRHRVSGNGRLGATVFTSEDLEATYTQVRRTVASEIEEHSIWDDIVIVQAGSGAIETGPRRNGVAGARARGPGEFQGGRFRKEPERLWLKAGDIVRIPGGIPHAFVPDPNVPFEYLIIKVRRPDRPLRR